MYKRLAAVRTDEDVDEVRAELADRYGTPPQPVDNLLAGGAAPGARPAGRSHRRHVAGQLRPVRAGRAARLRTVRLDRLYPKTVVKPAVRTILVPRPHDRHASAASRCATSPY